MRRRIMFGTLTPPVPRRRGKSSLSKPAAVGWANSAEERLQSRHILRAVELWTEAPKHKRRASEMVPSPCWRCPPTRRAGGGGREETPSRETFPGGSGRLV
jgi:hypothetical protein